MDIREIENRYWEAFAKQRLRDVKSEETIFFVACFVMALIAVVTASVEFTKTPATEPAIPALKHSDRPE